MKKIRIALISDLHVGEKARGLDLCPYELPEDAKVGRSPDFISRFELWALENAKRDGQQIDCLCIAGDISNSGHSEEFISADNALTRIIRSLDLSDDRVFYVPGNHDVFWPVMHLQPTSFWKKQRYAPLLQEQLRFDRRMRDATFGRFDDAPYSVVWQRDEILVVGINTSAYDSPIAAPHHGLIKQDTIEKLDEFLGSLDIADDCLRICLLHHHLEQYSEGLPDSADHSIAVNAENLTKMLSRHKMDVVFHGHKHYPRMGAKQPDNQHPFVLLCAGSFSAILPPLWYEGVPNLFHVVNVNGRDLQSGRVFGQVESWSFQGNRWQAGNGVAGLYASEAFGSGSTPMEVQQQIRDSLKSRMEKASACDWNAIVADSPNLGKIRTDVAYECFVTVSEELGYEVAGDKQTPSKKWVAFRRAG